MICPEPTMSRLRPHTGEQGRFHMPRSATWVNGLNIRDIQDAYVRAVCRCSTDQDLIENAARGVAATLHANHLFMIDPDKLDLLEVQRALGEELERLLGIFPNVQGEPETPVPQRRASDHAHMRQRRPGITGTIHDDDMIGVSFLPAVSQTLPMPAVKPPKAEDPGCPGCAAEGVTVRDVYNGWHEREKNNASFREICASMPKLSRWQRFWSWFK